MTVLDAVEMAERMNTVSRSCVAFSQVCSVRAIEVAEEVTILSVDYSNKTRVEKRENSLFFQNNWERQRLIGVTD